MNLPLSKEERYDVTLLCFMDTITRALLARTTPKTSRHTRLEELHRRIARADETYHGYLPDGFQAEAEKLLEEVELKIVALSERDDD